MPTMLKAELSTFHQAFLCRLAEEAKEKAERRLSHLPLMALMDFYPELLRDKVAKLYKQNFPHFSLCNY